MSKLLVTGGAGFIGSNFVQYWVDKYPLDSIVVLDKLTYAGNLASLPDIWGESRYQFVHGDICDQSLVEDLLRDNSLDTIVHFAAESHVDRSIDGPDEFLNTNIIGTHTLLKAAKRIWIDEKSVVSHRFHHVSTDEVYGSLGADDPAFTEKTQYAPNSPYAASKAASDHLVRAYFHTYGLEVTTSNCSNNYGPYHFPEKLIPLIITNILNNQSLPVYGDGLQIRDWLHVDDHARGIEFILQEGVLGEVYNIGGNNEWVNIDVVKILCEEVDQQLQEMPELQNEYPMAPIYSGKESKSLISYVEDRPGHDVRYAIDSTKIVNHMDFKPLVSFEEGIKKTVTWYLNNAQWWRDLLPEQGRSVCIRSLELSES